MKKKRLELLNLTLSQSQSGAYTLVLGEADGKRRLPIIIGNFEAQAIIIELENMTPNRPLTHDLFKNFAMSFEINIDEVVIYKLHEGIFFSKLICSNQEKQIEIDARTSDAVAMAVRFNCPIYTYEAILAQAGVLFEEESAPSESKPVKEKKAGTRQSKDKDITSLSTDELQELLQRAIEDEAYEKASQIRDELNKRKKSS
ncbi:MAG: bifunctional nuclease family protein [Bacteroidia bacterium]|nr:bifunctional nuclease family protein [Bacteroidia bacterium]